MQYPIPPPPPHLPRTDHISKSSGEILAEIGKVIPNMDIYRNKTTDIVPASVPPKETQKPFTIIPEEEAIEMDSSTFDEHKSQSSLQAASHAVTPFLAESQQLKIESSNSEQVQYVTKS